MWKKLISKVDLEAQPPVLSWSYAHAGSCTKVCWTQLRISEQNGKQITQSFYSLFGWPQIQKGRIGNSWRIISWRIIWPLLENREKNVYIARIGRPDILWTVNYLARSVTTRNSACHQRLARRMSCVHHTGNYRQDCHVGNKARTWVRAFSGCCFRLETWQTLSLRQEEYGA